VTSPARLGPRPSEEPDATAHISRLLAAPTVLAGRRGVLMPAGRRRQTPMLGKADVRVENMAPGTIERLGLSYDEMKKIDPAMTFAEPAVRERGQVRERLRLRPDRLGRRRQIGVTRGPNRPPVKPGPSFGDTVTGILKAPSCAGPLPLVHRADDGSPPSSADAESRCSLACAPALPPRSAASPVERCGDSLHAYVLGAGLYRCRSLATPCGCAELPDGRRMTGADT